MNYKIARKIAILISIVAISMIIAINTSKKYNPIMYEASSVVMQEFGIAINTDDIMLQLQVDTSTPPVYASAEIVCAIPADTVVGKSILRLFTNVEQDTHKDSVETIAHELLHIGMRKSISCVGIPKWFLEGSAELISTGARRSMAMGIDENEPIDMSLLMSNNPIHWSGSQMQYVVAYLMVKFIDDEFGRRALKNILIKVHKGISFDMALKEVIGINDWEILQAIGGV